MLIFLLLSVKMASAAWGLGRCKKVDMMENFNRTQFAGEWHEIYSDLDQNIWVKR
jgi:hypothetical protein